MNKFILLGDLHFGAKMNSLQFFKETQLPFFKDQLIPYMKKNKIKKIIQLGDLLHSRTVLDIILWYHVKKEIFDIFEEQGIEIIFILGNHDIAYKNTLEVTFLHSIAKMYENVQVIDKDTVIEINDKKCLFVPWICKEHELDISLLTEVEYVFGHFELNNFEVIRGHIINHGLDPKIFNLNNIKKCYSGHFHIKQERGNISYIGTPYQLDFGDFNLKKGFYVIDENFKEKFIENTKSARHLKLRYREQNGKEKELIIQGYNKDIYCRIDNIPFKKLKNQYIKFYIDQYNTPRYEEYIYILKENKIEFEVFNNQEINKLIGMEIEEDNPTNNIQSYILDVFKKHEKSDNKTMNTLMEILRGIETP